MPDPSQAKPDLVPGALSGSSTQPPTLSVPEFSSAAGHEGPAFPRSVHPGDLGLLGRYRVLKELGRGGMGAVYLGYDEALRRRVALKVMLPRFAASPSAADRFLREARAAAAVKSDHVVTIYEVGQDAGIPFIAMEYLQGTPLDQHLKQTGTVTIDQAMRIGREAALGLAAAHECGLIHRDVKPANLWLEAPNGRVKLLDFGLARAEEEATQIGEPASDASLSEGGVESLTRTGTVLGTPAYMSPEQARGHKVDGRSDLFSLGGVLYRLLTGRLPFPGANQTEVLLRLAMEEPTPVRELNPTVSDGLARLVHQMLAKAPDQRPASAATVAATLGALGGHVSGSGQQVVYVPLAVEAQPESVWEQIEEPSESVTDAPRPKPRAKPRAQWPVVVVCVALGLLVVAGTIGLVAKALEKVQDLTVVPGARRVLVPPERKKDPKRDPDPTAVAGGPWRELFNGKNLTGWTAEPADGVRYDTVDGGSVLRIAPGTKLDSGESVRDYHLHVEFQSTPSRAPGHVAYHIQPGSAGGLQCQLGTDILGKLNVWNAQTRVLPGEVVGGRIRPKSQEPVGSVEPRPVKLYRAGAWNHLDLYCVGDTCLHVVNGQVVCAAAELRHNAVPLTGGRLQLSAYDELVVRAVRLRPIAALPAEFGGPADTPAAPGTIDLLPLVDPVKDTVNGKWERRPTGELASDAAVRARVGIPYRPPAEYDLRVSFTRTDGPDGVTTILNAAGKQFRFEVGGYGNTNAGFEQVDGKLASENRTAVRREAWLQTGRRYELELRVRADGVEALLDGAPVTKLAGGYAAVGEHTAWALSDRTLIGLGSFKSPTVFHKVELVERSGVGTFARPDDPAARNARRSGPEPPFFNGRDLTGWTGDTANFRVEGGVIIGTNPDRANRKVLSSAVSYRDFDLSFDAAWKGQAEVRFREDDRGVWHGVDFELAPRLGHIAIGTGDNNWAEVAQPVDAAKFGVKPGQFNRVHLRVVGQRVTATINGILLSDAEYPDLPASGRVGWFLGRGCEEFRVGNVRLIDLSKAHDPTFLPAGLAGWDPLDATWKVEDGVLIGTRTDVTRYGRLKSKRAYRDFELTFEARTKTGEAASLRFRRVGTLDTGVEIGKVAGNTFHLDTPKFTHLRGPSEAAAAAFKPGEFNRFRIRVEGRRVTAFVNGHPATDGEYPLVSPEGQFEWSMNPECAELRVKNVRFYDLNGPAPADVLTSADWEWLPPENLGPAVNSGENDIQPAVSADGLCLVFHSDRDGQPGLYESRRTSPAEPFGAPKRVDLPGVPNQTIRNPFLTADGLTLLFSARPDGAAVNEDAPGNRDLYIARRKTRDDPWGTPEGLGSDVNSPQGEKAAALFPDGRTLYFATNRASKVLGNSDLMVSQRTAIDGSFGKPVSLGPPVNSGAGESSPSPLGDGSAFVFQRWVGGTTPDLIKWLLARQAAGGAWELTDPNVPNPPRAQNPFLSPDGRTLYFDAARPGGQGKTDLWQMRRVPKASAVDRERSAAEQLNPFTDLWLTPADGRTVHVNRGDPLPAGPFTVRHIHFRSGGPALPDGFVGRVLLPAVRSLGELERIEDTVSWVRISEDEYEQLCAVLPTTITHVILPAPLTARTVAAIARLTSLEEVSFLASGAGDDVLAELTKHRLPEHVSLYGVNQSRKVTARGWDTIASLPVTSLTLGAPAHVPADVWPRLAKMSRLNRFRIWLTTLRKEDLAELAKSRTLRRLDLYDLPLTDDDLAPLVGSRVRYVRLQSTQVSQTGAQTLAERLPRCEVRWHEKLTFGPKESQDEIERKTAAWVLSRRGRVVLDKDPAEITDPAKLPAGPFRVTQVKLTDPAHPTADDDLVRLADCPELVFVQIWHGLVTDRGVETLAGFPQAVGGGPGGKGRLRVLVVESSKVSDAGLKFVGRMTGLTHLGLKHAAVTDAGLPALYGLTDLAYISLARTNVTASGVADLRKALPGCTIEWDGGTLKP